jgi:hypothetical protein
VRAEGHGDHVATVKQYGMLVREHERDIRAAAAAMERGCPLTSAANSANDLSANLCVTHLHRVGGQARRLTLSLNRPPLAAPTLPTSEARPTRSPTWSR